MNTLLAPALSLGVLTIAVVLALWQWVEARGRPSNLSAADRNHFRHQDLRRWVVSGLMLGLGILFFVGTRLSPRAGPRPNLAFVEIWVAVLCIVVALLVLAGCDWMATAQYARRHRQEIVREGMEILRDELRRRASMHSGYQSQPGQSGPNGAPDRNGN